MINETLDLDINSNSSSSLDSIGISRHKTITLYCHDCGQVKVVKLKCSDRTCQECRDRTYWKLFKGWFKLAENMSNPKLLTLTMKNKPDLKREYIKTLRAQFTKLLHRKYYKERIIGGLYVIELKNAGNGWNIHLHALIDTKPEFEGFLLQERLSKDWLAITKESMIVDIRKAYNPRASLKYILKYLTKPPQINGEIEVYNAALKKTRLIQTFGDLYRSKAEKIRMICKDCGCSTWIVEYEIIKLSRQFNKGKIHNIKSYNNDFG